MHEEEERRQHCDFNLDSEGHLLWLLASLSSLSLSQSQLKNGEAQKCYFQDSSDRESQSFW